MQRPLDRPRTLAPRLLVATLAWLALGAACATDAAPADPFVPEADRWVDIMEDVVGPIYSDYLVREAERGDTPMNFTAIAEQSRRAARHVALGHGIHEWKDVPRFGEYARDCEQWFLEIADRADAADADAVRRLILDGEVRHCDRCHIAAG